MRQTLKGIVIGCLGTILIGGGVTYALASGVMSRSIDVLFGNYKVYVDGVELVAADTTGAVIEPFAYNGNMFVPAEEIARAFGKGVNWVQETGSLWLGNMPPGAVPVQTPAPAEYVSLADMDYFVTERSGVGNWMVLENPRINTGDYYDSYVGLENEPYYTISSGTRDYLLNGEYTKLTGSTCLLFDYRSTKQIGTITIWGDGRTLYTSGDITAGFLPQYFEVDVKGVNIMRIEVDYQDANADSSVGIADPTLVK